MAFQDHVVEIPQTVQQVATSDRRLSVRKHDYEIESGVAVDLGTCGTGLDVDVVEGTAIVVSDSGQVKFEMPEDADEVTVHNGVLAGRETAR